MEKQCECHVMSFPATTDQCHWIAVAGTNSIVRYGLGSCGRYEGVVVSFFNFVVKGLANIDVTNCPIFSLLETVNGPVIGLTPLEFQTVCAWSWNFLFSHRTKRKIQTEQLPKSITLFIHNEKKSIFVEYFSLTGASSKIDRISIPLGTVLQEIKVDCGIDDRSSIVICKKGKAWEVTRIAKQNLRFLNSGITVWIPINIRPVRPRTRFHCKTIGENLRKRAVRDGASRAGKSRPWPRAKYLPVRPYHSVNKYILFVSFSEFVFLTVTFFSLEAYLTMFLPLTEN